MGGQGLSLYQPLAESAVKNYKAGTPFETGPIMMISGLNIRANLDCYTVPNLKYRDWIRKGPVCFLRFEANTGAWVGQRYIGPMTAEVMQGKFYHGLRIFIVPGGYFSFV